MWNPESQALGYGINIKESGIPITITIQNPSSTDKESESSTRNPESRRALCPGYPRLSWIPLTWAEKAKKQPGLI